MYKKKLIEHKFTLNIKFSVKKLIEHKFTLNIKFSVKKLNINWT